MQFRYALIILFFLAHSCCAMTFEMDDLGPGSQSDEIGSRASSLPIAIKSPQPLRRSQCSDANLQTADDAEKVVCAISHYLSKYSLSEAIKPIDVAIVLQWYYWGWRKDKISSSTGSLSRHELEPNPEGWLKDNDDLIAHIIQEVTFKQRREKEQKKELEALSGVERS